MKWILCLSVFFSFHARALELIDARKIVDKNDQYEMSLSSYFIHAIVAEFDSIKLSGNPNFESGELTPIVGFATPFAKSYPELITADVDTLRQTFANAKEIVLGDCKLGFLGVNSSTVYGVATWGKGRGIAIVMPFSPEMEVAVRKSLEAIELKPNACNW